MQIYKTFNKVSRISVIWKYIFERCLIYEHAIVDS